MAALDRGSPDALLGRVGLIGHPWHGLVSDGELILPNGLRKPYPQPAGSGWAATRSMRVEVPGLPAIARTEEEHEADIAAGRQWLTHAWLAGENQQLYTQELGPGSFLWIDEAGARWLVDATEIHGRFVTQTSPLPDSVVVTLKRFGVFGLPPVQEVALSVDVPELGFEELSGVELMGRRPVVQLFSVCPQGRDAVFALCISSGRHFFPLAWFALRLSGAGAAPAVEIECIATPTQTLGGAGWSFEDLGFASEPVPLYLKTSETLGKLIGGASTPPACARETHAFEYGLDYGFPQWGVSNISFNRASASMWRGGEDHRNGGFAGAIVGIYHDAAGARVPVTMDLEYTGTRVGAVNGETEGSLTYERVFINSEDSCIESGREVQQPLNFSYESTIQYADELAITYRVGDASLRFMWRQSASLTRGRRFLRDDVNGPVQFEAWGHATHTTIGPGLDAGVESSRSYHYGPAPSYEESEDVSLDIGRTLFSGNLAGHLGLQRRLRLMTGLDLSDLPRVQLPGRFHGAARLLVRPWLMSWGLHAVEVIGSTGAVGSGAWRKVLPDVTTVQGTVTLSPGRDMTIEDFVARHPGTGDIALSTEPVCWV